MNNLHGIVFAYRSNSELRELVGPRSTCSIPYGARYRLIDFTLSNLVNAGVTDVGVIVHTSYQSMLDHVGSGKDWDLSRKHGGLRVLPPFSYAGRQQSNRFRGRMDALAGVYSYLQGIRQDYVVLMAGDIVANLPLAEALEQHIATGADITAICAPGAKADPKMTTYFTLDGEGKIIDVADCPNEAIGDASLDAYILSKSLLISLVDKCNAHGEGSFTKGVLMDPRSHLNIRAYRFQGYSAYIQTVNAYFQRSMDLLDRNVRDSLFVESRPIKTKDQSNPSTYYGKEAKSVNSLVADGCVIQGTVINSVLARGVRVEAGAVVENCVLMQGTTVQTDATLRYVIADKNVRVCPGRMLMGHGTYPLLIAKGEIV